MNSSINLITAKEILWDVIIIGAGPAGSFTAITLKNLDPKLQVLILEKEQFPRQKVCGCCLSPRGVEILSNYGVYESLKSYTLNLNEAYVLTKNSCKSIKLTGGVTINRDNLDFTLLENALSKDANVIFQIKVEDISIEENNAVAHILDLKNHSFHQFRSKIIIKASGLSGINFLNERKNIDSNSYIGIGGITSILDPEPYINSVAKKSKIYMALGNDGYLGCVQLADNQIDFAGALSPKLIKSQGSIDLAVQHILKDTNLENLIEFLPKTWKATPQLSRTSSLSGIRYFSVGDACGYVEPFTGEGMTWALESALLVSPLVIGAVKRWDDLFIIQWSLLYNNKIKKSQLISQNLKHNFDGWINTTDYKSSKIENFAIHPGGPKIIETCVSTLNASKDSCLIAKNVLRNFGNMSSVTILFVLESLFTQKIALPFVAVGFGPGITVEMMLIGASQ